MNVGGKKKCRLLFLEASCPGKPVEDRKKKRIKEVRGKKSQGFSRCNLPDSVGGQHPENCFRFCFASFFEGRSSSVEDVCYSTRFSEGASSGC